MDSSESVTSQRIAYFSMEIGLEDHIKTYAGGLGILSGDTLKSAADMGLNMVGVSILYKNGYFKQEFDEHGYQVEASDAWDFQNNLSNTGKIFKLDLACGSFDVEIWKYDIVSADENFVPVYFLNTDLDQNEDRFRYISYNLYTPFEETMFIQMLTLGIGGVKALQAMGHESFDVYHLNESHAAFGILELNKQFPLIDDLVDRIRFTTHTPAEHGHKIYPREMLETYLQNDYMSFLEEDLDENNLHLTKFALKYSKVSNAVSQRHTEISSTMFSEYEIESITNGVHVTSWAGDHTHELFNQYFPGWQYNPEKLSQADSLPFGVLVEMHKRNKQDLFAYIHDNFGTTLKPNVFTLGFARRVDGYKRWDFMFKHLSVLETIAEQFGGLQVIYAGKSYPDYKDGEEAIKKVRDLSLKDLGALKVVFIPDYSMKVGKLMVQGVDLWVNNPTKPLEASGTSGMKAALNGVPNFSVVDGWWVEGWEEGVTGWSIGKEASESHDGEYELYDFYAKLEYTILPMYHRNQISWHNVMKNAISKNAPYFNTHRMLSEYLEKSYSI